MILKRNPKNTGDAISSEEVSRLMSEIQKMKEISEASEARNQMMSEKIDMLNVQVAGSSRSSSRKASNDSEKETNRLKYPEIQIIVDSDENRLSLVCNFICISI